MLLVIGVRGGLRLVDAFGLRLVGITSHLPPSNHMCTCNKEDDDTSIPAAPSPSSPKQNHQKI